MYIMSLDQGTTSSRCIIFDKEGKVVSIAQKEFKQIFTQKGWVEHNAIDILTSQLDVIRQAMSEKGISYNQIDSIGIANQRETTIVWDKETSKPVSNAIVWQCRRTADYCNELKKQGLADFIYSKTGLVLDSYFSATKLKWILDNVSGARAKAKSGKLAFGTVDTYLMWMLSGGAIHKTDYTNASRTMLFNIHTLQWDDELLKLFDIPRQMLPEIAPSSHEFGVTSKSVLGAEIPICGVAGDQQAALFGQLRTKAGDIKNTYGTGCFLLMHTGNTPAKSSCGLLTTLAASLDSKAQYALEGSVFVGGAVVQWLRDGLKLIKSSAETEEIAQTVKDNGGVYFVPAFVGLGAPYWNPDVRGELSGLTRGTTSAHIIRAALESIAYQTFDVCKAMEKDADKPVKYLTVDGGASANNFLMQFQSDILQLPIIRPKIVETTALGAAYLAGLKTGYWSGVEKLRTNAELDRSFMPSISAKNAEELVFGWQRAVKKAIGN